MIIFVVVAHFPIGRLAGALPQPPPLAGVDGVQLDYALVYQPHFERLGHRGECRCRLPSAFARAKGPRQLARAGQRDERRGPRPTFDEYSYKSQPSPCHWATSVTVSSLCNSPCNLTTCSSTCSAISSPSRSSALWRQPVRADQPMAKASTLNISVRPVSLRKKWMSFLMR